MKTASATDYYLKKLAPLVGGKITRLVRTGPPDDEYDSEEMFGFSIAMQGGKKYTLLLLRDDEGNGPGSFELTEERP